MAAPAAERMRMQTFRMVAFVLAAGLVPVLVLAIAMLYGIGRRTQRAMRMEGGSAEAATAVATEPQSASNAL